MNLTSIFKKGNLAFIGLLGTFVVNAQVSEYGFSHQVDTYSELSSPTVLIQATADNDYDVFYQALPEGTIPFLFNFNGNNYNTLTIFSDGFVTFGDYLPGTSYSYQPITTTSESYMGVVAAFTDDLVALRQDNNLGQIAYGVEGDAPNREFVIEWKNFTRYQWTGYDTDYYKLNFQIRLHENGDIRYRYNVLAQGQPLNRYISVGLKGASFDDFATRFAEDTDVQNWTSTVTGTAQTQKIYTAHNILPPVGLTYHWTKPVITQQVEQVQITMASGGSTTLTEVGQTIQLLANVIPASVNQEVNWEVVSGMDVVSIDATGVVTAIAQGEATVRATSVLDGSKFEEIIVQVELEDDCQPMATIDENFGLFTTFPANCWGASQVPIPAMMMIVGGAIQLYSFTLPNSPIYIVTPELSTIDGMHSLSFEVQSVSATGTEIQIGTLTDQNDFSTFIAVGDTINPESGQTYTTVSIPAQLGHKYVAIKFIPNGSHKAIVIDNIRWQPDTVGINEFEEESLLVYPNPVSEHLFVKHSDGIRCVKIFDIQGNKVLSVNDFELINISQLSAGMYLLHITSNLGDVQVRKIIKK
ncbi:MAG: T9SS type A sorting domain-containing protein [Bacteroidota bacterium]|nr:T9SS type A sorting domain-containing protein [Bacteroidota bacterium]